MQTRRRTLLLGAAIGGAVTAPRQAAAGCLPGEPLSPPPAVAAPSATGARVPAATIFLDVSRSMQGYVPEQGRTADTEPRPFRDIVLSLPQIFEPLAERVAPFQFGLTIRPLPPAALSGTTRQGPHVGSPQLYQDNESRIHEVLGRINALPADQLGVVLTDLFLSGQDMLRGAALRTPLAAMLDGGRAIALIGIRSGFNGPIFDVPGATQPYRGATERPFFIIAAGPLHAVAGLTRRLETVILDPMAPPREGRRHHAVIFTAMPLLGASAALAFAPEGSVTAARDLLRDDGADVQRFRFSGRSGELRATLALSRADRAPVLMPGQFRLRERVWAVRPNSEGRACDARWAEVPSVLPVARLSQGPSGEALATIGGAGLARVPPDRPMLLRLEASAFGLADDPPETRWTRDWSFSPAAAQTLIARRPAFFPALNLAEVARMLEGMAREKLAEPRPVAEALVAFQVARG